MYLWIKALHIIFVFAWVAGLLIFPRYKLHQASGKAGEALFDTLSGASARLRCIILTPAMIATWVFGITLVSKNPALMSEKWLWVKVVLVVALSGYHGALISIGRKVDNSDPSVSRKTLQLLNEVPFVLFAIITVLVVVRPF